MNNQEIDKTIRIINENMDALKEGIQPEILKPQEKQAIRKELAITIRLALKIKLKAQKDQIEHIIDSLDSDENIDLIQLQKATNDLDKTLSFINRKAA